MIVIPNLPFQLEHETFALWQQECIESKGSFLAIVWDEFEQDYYPIYVKDQSELIECTLAWDSDEEVTEKIILVFNVNDWTQVPLSDLIIK